MNKITLAGCTPTPLASYLKALGALRLLSDIHPNTSATWQGDCFVLHTTFSAQDLENFFLRDYQPTPILAPWNGGSGFYYQERKSKEKDPTTGKKKKLGVRDQATEATRVVDAIISSKSSRLQDYGSALQHCKEIVVNRGHNEAPKGEDKDNLILALRSILPDECLSWLDAAILLTSDQGKAKSKFPPLLGSGGNDGNMDFTSNFMQKLVETIGLDNEKVPDTSSAWLRAALFGGATPSLSKSKIGQFAPGNSGGVNSTIGFNADSIMNPWDYVLMLEGAMTFAAAAVRRGEAAQKGSLSYPFTVHAVSAGAGNLGGDDTMSGRGEVWMPLWERPATFLEIDSLFREGRVILDRKPARDGLDFVRAIHRLGAYRGIKAFQRYGILKRNGDAHYAVPLSYVGVSTNPKTEWLDDLDQHDWLTQFRRFAQGDNAAKRFLAVRRQLEEALFELAGHEPRPVEIQAVLRLLGGIQEMVANSKKAQEAVPPVPRLSERWIQAADDGTSAFRIACALAGLSGTREAPLPLRAQLFSIHPKFNTWMEDARKAKGAANDPACRLRIHTDLKGNLVDTLIALLDRRLWLAEQFKMEDKPLRSPVGIDLDDLVSFLRGDQMDRRITGLVSGLSLCGIPHEVEHTAGEGVVPAAFALLKLCLTPESILRKLGGLGEQEHLPIPPGLVAQLAGGNIDNRAVKLAWRRLHASGLAPLFRSDALPEFGEIDPRRAAAALLIPLRFGAVGALSRSVLRAPEPETA